MSRKYKWLLFDADNTLLDFSLAEKCALVATLRGAHLPDGDEIVAAYSEINDSMWKMLERGEITKERLRTLRFERFCLHFGFGADPLYLADSYVENLKSNSQLCEGAEELCRSLFGKYKLYIITNGILEVQRARFGGSAICKYFEHTFVSDEIGVEKPSPLFFDAVASAIDGFDCKQALVIGDSLSSDIRGGINYGIDTCWYNPAKKAKPDGMDITYTVERLRDIETLLEGVDE